MKQHSTKSSVAISKLWEAKTGYEFNQIIACPVFRDKKPNIVTAGQDGIVRVHSLPCGTTTDQPVGVLKVRDKLETKGGPIQLLLAQDVTRFNGIDLVSADSRGLLVIFSNNQILNRRVIVDSCVCAMCMDSDSANNWTIVIGARDGTIAAVTAYSVLWKLNLNDIAGDHVPVGLGSLGVTSMQHYSISQHGVDVNYVAVGDTCGNLHLLQAGHLVKTFHLKVHVVSMSAGNFTRADSKTGESFASPNKHGQSGQHMLPLRGQELAVALQDGTVVIVRGLSQTTFHQFKAQLSQILTITSSSSLNSDILVCVGQFNCVYLLRDGVIVSQYDTCDWVKHVTVLSAHDKESSSSASVDLVVACADSSVQQLSITC